MSAEDDLARKRYMVLMLLRFAGAAMALLGALIIGHRIALPAVLGDALLINGALDALVIPVLLARKWHSKP